MSTFYLEWEGGGGGGGGGWKRFERGFVPLFSSWIFFLGGGGGGGGGVVKKPPSPITAINFFLSVCLGICLGNYVLALVLLQTQEILNVLIMMVFSRVDVPKHTVTMLSV